MKWRSLACVAMGCLVLTGCALNPFSDSDEDVISLVLEVEASDDLNPDMTGQPSPIEIRLFQLRSLTEFERSDFFDLYKEQPLPSSLLATRIFIIKPSASRRIETDLNTATKYIGMVAGYRDLDRAIWYDSIQVQDDRGFLRRLIGSHKRMTLKADAKKHQISLAIDQE